MTPVVRFQWCITTTPGSAPQKREPHLTFRTFSSTMPCSLLPPQRRSTELVGRDQRPGVHRRTGDPELVLDDLVVYISRLDDKFAVRD